MSMPAIPSKIALALCQEIVEQNAKKRLSIGKMMCWGCTKYSPAPEQRCWANDVSGSNRGCPQVNEAFDKASP